MRCKQCDYSLWNLKARTCPECGTPFAPGEFEFVPNSVRFCCPSCDQSYYGTGENGHLVPREFDCTSCGIRIRMDEMILRPAQGVSEERTRADVVPWIDRQQRRWIMAWLRTVWLGIVGPARFMSALPEESRPRAAWGYATWTIFVIVFFGAGLLFFGIATLDLIFGGGNDTLQMLMIGGITTAGFVALFLLAILVWGLAAHAILRVGEGTKHSIGHTYEALCYSIGSNAPTAIPCFGFYPLIFVGLIWWVISAVIMTARRHSVTGVRAAVAVLALPVLIGVLGVGGGFGGLLFFMSKLPSIISQAQAEEEVAQTKTQLAAIEAYGAANSGSAPAHMIELVADGSLIPSDFVISGAVSSIIIATGPGGPQQFESRSDTSTADIPLADITLERFGAIPEERQANVVSQVVESLPANIVAHRVGDYVFTYHGIDLSGADPDLWLVVLAPDPDVNSGGYGGNVIVGLADGSAEEIDPGFFPAELAEQNALRATSGLSPLPDPLSVTHARPAGEGE